MSFRFMRVVLFYDLPAVTFAERRIHAKFRRTLVKDGFIMLQESVYCKLALNMSYVNAIIKDVEKYKPEIGLIQILTITENQYERMIYVLGEKTSNVIDSNERIVFI